jgi:hypothetical protein
VTAWSVIACGFLNGVLSGVCNHTPALKTSQPVSDSRRSELLLLVWCSRRLYAVGSAGLSTDAGDVSTRIASIWCWGSPSLREAVLD